MYAQVDKQKENKNRAVVKLVAQKKSNVKQGIGFNNDRASVARTYIPRIGMNNVAQRVVEIGRSKYESDDAIYEAVKKKGVNLDAIDMVLLKSMANENENTYYYEDWDVALSDNSKKTILAERWEHKDDAKPTENLVVRMHSQHREIIFDDKWAIIGTDYNQNSFVDLLEEINGPAMPLFMSGYLYNIGQDWTIEANNEFIKKIISDERTVILKHNSLGKENYYNAKTDMIFNSDMTKEDGVKNVIAVGEDPRNIGGTIMELSLLLKAGYKTKNNKAFTKQ